MVDVKTSSTPLSVGDQNSRIILRPSSLFCLKYCSSFLVLVRGVFRERNKPLSKCYICIYTWDCNSKTILVKKKQPPLRNIVILIQKLTLDLSPTSHSPCCALFLYPTQNWRFIEPQHHIRNLVGKNVRKRHRERTCSVPALCKLLSRTSSASLCWPVLHIKAAITSANYYFQQTSARHFWLVVFPGWRRLQFIWQFIKCYLTFRFLVEEGRFVPCCYPWFLEKTKVPEKHKVAGHWWWSV